GSPAAIRRPCSANNVERSAVISPTATAAIAARWANFAQVQPTATLAPTVMSSPGQPSHCATDTTASTGSGGTMTSIFKTSPSAQGATDTETTAGTALRTPS